MDLFVWLFCCLVGCGGRKHANRHKEGQTQTATLTAHVRRGLITEKKCQTLVYQHETVIAMM